MHIFNLKDAPSQEGKIIIVTGANTGLGYETTLGLAQKGAKVIMACRNEKKAQEAKEEVLRIEPQADLEIMLLNLSSFQSVRSFVEVFKSKYQKLDVLINNAGIMIPPFARTEEGFESQIGVNYFAHFLLTQLLLPILKKTENSRVVSLSSKAHERGRINFESLATNREVAEKEYSRIAAYSQSKLACLMFAYELQRKLESEGSHVISVAAHPGVSETNLFQFIPRWFYILTYPFMKMITHNPKKAALPSLQAAIDPESKGGDYFGPTGFRGMKGKPGKVQSKPHSHDLAVAKKLWNVSLELVKN